MNLHYSFVAERAAHRCEYCRAPEIIFNVPFEVDHIIPLCKGGEEGPRNYALARRACNLWKSDAITAVDPESQETIPLFNPRMQEWQTHFEIQPNPPFKLIGKTPAGRATIIQLRINAPLQLIARSQWVLLGIFP